MDEHVPLAVTEGLRRRGVDVQRTQDAGMLHADDLAQLTYATAQGRAFFIQDADFLRLAASGVAHTGIAYAPQGIAIGTLVRGLVEITAILCAEDMVNWVEYL